MLTALLLEWMNHTGHPPPFSINILHNMCMCTKKATLRVSFLNVKWYKKLKLRVMICIKRELNNVWFLDCYHGNEGCNIICLGCKIYVIFGNVDILYNITREWRSDISNQNLKHHTRIETLAKISNKCMYIEHEKVT